MQFASKWLLVSAIVALLVVIFGTGNYFVSNKLLSDAVEECEQDKAAKAKQPITQDGTRERWKSAPIVRDEDGQKGPWKDYDALAKEFGGKAIENDQSHQGKSIRWLDFDDLAPGCDKTIQTRVGEYRSEATASTFYGYCFSALLIIFVGAIPYIWYFFLRRLSEIAEALRGKR